MWYLLHQQAQEIIAEHDREAARRRLLRDDAMASRPGTRAELRRASDALRTAAARLARATGRLAQRVALALDPSDEATTLGDPSR